MSRRRRNESKAEIFQFAGSPELIKKLQAIDHALDADEVARLLRVSKKHVYKQAAKGAIPSFRFGAAVRFDPGAVAQWLRHRMSPQSVGVAGEAKIAV
jgi:excisionase family DNA binding protein